MNREAIGICGSRDASAEGLRIARRIGQFCAEQGRVLISGYARGVDREAHKGALEAGGRTLAILPEGMDRFRVLRELKPLVDMESNFLALSMFEADATWTVWRALERNKLIVGLSRSLILVEAREHGGSIAAGYECKRQGKKLWAYAIGTESPERAGNAKLLRQAAALPLKTRDDLLAALEMRTEPEDVAFGQIPLAV